MHKYFAKTLFLGKNLEYLPECHSTNQEMLIRLKADGLKEGAIIYADFQTKGRGQRGNAWLSERGKNLLFSLYLTPRQLMARQAYLINIIAGLAVVDALGECGLSAELKWPNDVYVMDQKIAGILVETSIDGHQLENAIVGIGLNVNQGYYPLTGATSIKLHTGKDTDRLDLLEDLLVHLEKYYLKIKSGQLSGILAGYYRVMRWRGELHHFNDGHQEFEGEIIGVDDTGRLLIKTKELMRRFDVKEISFLY